MGPRCCRTSDQRIDVGAVAGSVQMVLENIAGKNGTAGQSQENEGDGDPSHAGPLLYSLASSLSWFFIPVRTLLSVVFCVVLCTGLSRAQEGQERSDPRDANLPDTNPVNSADGIAKGRQYFLGHCAVCHGPAGEGGRGVNLTTGQYRHGSSDRELFRTIQKGIDGTEMPGNGLSQPELWRIVAYVRSLATQSAPEKASGDPAAGRALYEGKGACAQCHWVDRRGGVLGPDLSEIGLRRPLRF